MYAKANKTLKTASEALFISSGGGDTPITFVVGQRYARTKGYVLCFASCRNYRYNCGLVAVWYTERQVSYVA